MQVLSGVFFQVQPGDLYFHRSPFDGMAGIVPLSSHNLEFTVCRKWLIVLLDLVTLRQVGIEIVLAGEDRLIVDVQPESERSARAEFDRPFVQHGKSPRQAETNWTGILVGCVVKSR